MSQLVSILIPCYNAAPWLAETLESVFSQTYPNKEAVLVDDGSTDDSLAIARRYESRGLTIITQPNLGASAARNTALAASHGDWFQFLDADDLLATDKIAHQMDLAIQVGPKFVLCSTWSRFTKTIADADFTPQPLCTDTDPLNWVVTNLEHNLMMHPAAWLVSRELVRSAGPWVETLSLNDDGEYFNRIVLASQGVRHCSAAISYYRSCLPGSLSKARSEKAWASAYRVIELCTSRLLAAEISPRTRLACATAFQRYIFESYPYASPWRSQAEAQISALGGSQLIPDGGPKFQLTRRLLGWRLAKRLQQLTA